MTPELHHEPDPLVCLRRYQEILADFSRMAADSSDIDRLLQLATVQAGRGLGIAHAKILRHRPDRGDLLIVAGVGWQPGVVGHVTLGTDIGSAPGQALQTGSPTFVDDLARNTDTRYAPVLREHGIVSTLDVPIVVEGAPWGVLEVDSDVPRHFGAQDAQFLLTLANILGLALHARRHRHDSSREAAEAARALVTQKVRLQELQHRSRNDFQLIISLLMLQKRKQPDALGRRGLVHVMDRIAAIGMAYNQLSDDQERGLVELSDYLQALCGSLRQRKEGVRIDVDLVAIALPHERAVLLGLIVNELITNALKHAYPDDRPGTITVAFHTTADGQGILDVRDDGVGMGLARPGSLGTELVQRLVQQTGGRMRHEALSPGTRVTVRFPLVI